MTRWTLADPATGETWEMPLNPYQMTTPHAPDQTQIFTRSLDTVGSTGGVSRVMVGKRQPHEWSFTGRIRSQDHYTAFLNWTGKRTRVHLTDHLGRTWDIRFQTVDLDEQKPTPNRDFRFEYTVHALLYGDADAPKQGTRVMQGAGSLTATGSAA